MEFVVHESVPRQRHSIALSCGQSVCICHRTCRQQIRPPQGLGYFLFVVNNSGSSQPIAHFWHEDVVNKSTRFINYSLAFRKSFIPLPFQDHQIKFLVYTVAQLIIGVLVYCLSASTYMHLIDLTTSSYHRIFANINISFFLLGEVVCLGVYFITKNWRLTSWACILCTILCFVMYNFFALESPR